MVAALPASSLVGNIVLNPDFNTGTNNLDSYEAFAEWFQPAGPAGFASAWALADAPVTADGSGTAVFRMNTQLALADAFWTGAEQVMTFQQNFAPGPLYSEIIQFTGVAIVTEAYAPGNLGEAFIQFLDTGWNSVFYAPIDVSTLGPSGVFSITATVPASGLNLVQIGFRNTGIEGTAGEMTVSDLSLVIIPEPRTYALLFGLFGLGVVLYRRRRR